MYIEYLNMIEQLKRTFNSNLSLNEIYDIIKPFGDLEKNNIEKEKELLEKEEIISEENAKIEYQDELEEKEEDFGFNKASLDSIERIKKSFLDKLKLEAKSKQEQKPVVQEEGISDIPDFLEEENLEKLNKLKSKIENTPIIKQQEDKLFCESCGKEINIRNSKLRKIYSETGLCGECFLINN